MAERMSGSRDAIVYDLFLFIPRVGGSRSAWPRSTYIAPFPFILCCIAMALEGFVILFSCALSHSHHISHSRRLHRDENYITVA